MLVLYLIVTFIWYYGIIVAEGGEGRGLQYMPCHIFVGIDGNETERLPLEPVTLADAYWESKSLLF